MNKVFFVVLVFCVGRSVAQQQPVAFVSAGKGAPIISSEPWKVELNASALVGYRVSSGAMVITSFDYIRETFGDYYKGGAYFTANRRTYSMATGAKLSLFIPNNHVSPYFMGAIGLSRITSSSDSVFEYTGGTVSLILLRARSGTTASFLAAFGVDADIYRGITAFGEIRGSAGLKVDIYDFFMMARAGVGIAIY